jgi:hypothetical protein
VKRQLSELDVETLLAVTFWVWGIFAFVSGTFTSWVAEHKGRSQFAWFMLGTLFAPIPLIALAGVEKRAPRPSAAERMRSAIDKPEADR